MLLRHLLDALQNMTDEQLNQPIQVAGPLGYSPVELMPCIAIDTVGGFEFEGARSSVDNKYHASDVVLLIDRNPFAEDGTLAYELDEMIPVYGKNGPTPRELQFSNKEADK